MSREVVLVIVLFNNLPNNINSMGRMDFVEILCFSTNAESIKQCMNLESTRV